MAMIDKLTVLVLTRHRASHLRLCISSLLATVDVPVYVIVGFDDDLLGYHTMPPWRDVHKVLLMPRSYYVRGVNALYRYAKGHVPDFDHFMLINDDVEFVKPGWATSAISLLYETWPDGMGVLECTGPEACAHYLTRSAVIDSMFQGRLAWPGYTMYCSDTEMLVRLRAEDRIQFVSDGEDNRPILIHQEVKDEMRREVETWARLDRELYNERAKEFGWEQIT